MILQTQSISHHILPSISTIHKPKSLKVPNFVTIKQNPTPKISLKCSISVISDQNTITTAQTKPYPGEVSRTIMELSSNATLSTLTHDGWPLGIGVRFTVDADGTPILCLNVSNRHFSLDKRSTLHVQLDQCGLRTPQCTIQGSLDRPEDKMLLKKLHSVWKKRFGEEIKEDLLYVVSVDRVLQQEDFQEDGVWVSSSDYKSACSDPLRDIAEEIVTDINTNNMEDVIRFCNIYADLQLQRFAWLLAASITTAIIFAWQQLYTEYLTCRESFVNMLADKQFRETEERKAKAQISHAQPDDLIDFYHLKSRKAMSQLELEDEVQDDLKRTTGEFTKDNDDANRLNRILQLTGFSDPVYAEAYVTVHHYDIVLDVTVINRTKETLQNLCLELATMGDLKLVERPQNYTLAPESSKQIKANIKVSSTETGVIFGNIVYETSNVLKRNVVVLNDIHIDIMDYISPATCADVAFRTMWAEFEWENKVAVTTVIQDEEFLDHIIKSTNMKCLTPPSALEGECGFLAANLYAKIVFGEDALVNVSIEKQSDGKLSGYIRIRSKTQGIALSLGDKITLKQKGAA